VAEEDPVQQAAAQVAGLPSPAPTVPGAAPETEPRKYPSPMKYKGDAFAEKINGTLDKAGDPEPGILHAPASTVMVAECAMATAETMGIGVDGKDVPIHPGWLLLMSILAYAAMVAFFHFVVNKPGARRKEDAPRRRLDAASIL
jgi:hypothetical protein